VLCCIWGAAKGLKLLRVEGEAVLQHQRLRQAALLHKP
jgi:hypothetical protein